MSNIIYLRVSTTDQTVKNQLIEFDEAKIKYDKVFADEGISGKSMDNRPQLHKMLDYVREGDSLFVVDESRLGRNQIEVAKIKKILDSKDVELISLETAILFQQLGLLGLKASDDDGSMDFANKWYMKQQMGMIFNYFSDIQRKQMLKKQKVGIARAREEGKYRGSKAKYRADTTNKKDLNTFNEVVKRLKSRETILKIANELGISRNTVKRIKKREDV